MTNAASTRRLGAASAALGALAFAGAGLAATPAYPPFPTATGLTDIGAWLTANTDVALPRVVGVGDESVFVLEPTNERADPPLRRAVIRQEVISAAFARQVGGRSMVMTVDVDCAGRRVFQRALNLYAGNNRQGAVRALGAGREWTVVPEGSFIENAVAAACDPTTPPIFGAAPPAQVAAAPLGRTPSAVLRPIQPSRPPLALVQPSRPAPAARTPAPAPAPAAAPVTSRTVVATPAPPILPAAQVQPSSPDAPIVTARVAVPPPAQAAPATSQPVANPPPPPSQGAAPPAEPAVPPAPIPAAPARQVAAPVQRPAPQPASRPASVAPQPAARPAPRPAPPASALGLRPLALARAEIGIFPTTEAAIAAWRQVAAAYPGPMAGKRQRIELTTAGGATRFRTFVDGFATAAEAAAFCRQLAAASRTCRADE